MNYWFTADMHLHHANIIGYCKRPFNNILEMNEELVKRWRDTVKPEDIVFHLGDFSFANQEITSRIINVLTGTIIFLKGNHERYPKSIIESLVIRHDGHSIHLNHYPERANPLMVSLCGHVHEKWLIQYHHVIPIYKDEQLPSKGFPIINVGVDRWDFRPVSFDQIQSVIKKQQIDHGILRGQI